MPFIMKRKLNESFTVECSSTGESFTVGVLRVTTRRDETPRVELALTDDVRAFKFIRHEKVRAADRRASRV